MKFGEALAAIVAGSKMARSGWNGKGMWVTRVWGVTTTINGEGVQLEPFLVIRTADGKFVPWTASQADVLATDWTTAG